MYTDQREIMVKRAQQNDLRRQASAYRLMKQVKNPQLGLHQRAASWLVNRVNTWRHRSPQTSTGDERATATSPRTDLVEA